MPIRAECGPMCPLFLKERSPVGYLLAMKTEKPAMGPLGAYRLQKTRKGQGIKGEEEEEKRPPNRRRK